MKGLRVLEKGLISLVPHATSLIDLGKDHPGVYSIHLNAALNLLQGSSASELADSRLAHCTPQH